MPTAVCRLCDEFVKDATRHSFDDRHEVLPVIALSSSFDRNEVLVMAEKSARALLFAGAMLALASWSAGALSADVSGKVPSVSSADTQFSQKAAAAGVAEIQLGQLALEKSSDKQVKSLAQQIVDDHRKTDAELASLRKQKQLTLPSKPAAEATKAYAKLSKKSGQAFDQAWAKLIIKDHQDAMKLFRAESSKGKDTDLRKFAAANLPTLQEHLKSAQQITAFPGARDKAMDSTMKTMSAGDLEPPAPAATAASVPVTTPTSASPAQTPTTAAEPATVKSAPVSPATPSSQKH